MANFYTNSEMTDIHFMYGKAKGNASKVARLYHATYSNRRQPNRRMFSKIHQRLRETGQFKSHLVDHLLEFLHSRKIFYAQLKKILEHLVEESPCKKDQAITLCGTFCMINFCIPIMSRSDFYQLICNHFLSIASSLMQSRSTIFVQYFVY